MKKLVLIVLGVVVVLVGAALALPFVVPTDTYRQQLEAQVERATGRALTIAGPMEFSILPRLALAAEDVRFANPPGAAEADMASLQGAAGRSSSSGRCCAARSRSTASCW